MKTFALIVAFVLVSVPVCATTLFSDDFESGNLNQWQLWDTEQGQFPTFSTEQVHSGSYSIKFDQIRDMLHHDFSNPITNVDVSFWFYDGLTQSSEFSVAIYRTIEFSEPDMGFVHEDDYEDYYISVLDHTGPGVSIYNTGISRSSNWLRGLYKVRPEGTTLTIGDGVTDLYTSPLFSQMPEISKLMFIEHSYNSVSGIFYVDDVLITDLSVPEPAMLLSLAIGGIVLMRRKRR